MPPSFSLCLSESCRYVAGGAIVFTDGVHTLYAARAAPDDNVDATMHSTTFKIDQI